MLTVPFSYSFLLCAQFSSCADPKLSLSLSLFQQQSISSFNKIIDCNRSNNVTSSLCVHSVCAHRASHSSSAPATQCDSAATALSCSHSSTDSPLPRFWGSAWLPATSSCARVSIFWEWNYVFIQPRLHVCQNSIIVSSGPWNSVLQYAKLFPLTHILWYFNALGIHYSDFLLVRSECCTVVTA